MTYLKNKCVLAIMVVPILVLFFGCSSVASIGDVKEFEKTQVIENFHAQIRYYNDQIEKLQVVLPVNLSESERASIYTRNEALIKEYSAKIYKLENEIDRFLVLSSKDQVTRLDFTGSPKEVSNAYLLVQYANNLGDQNNFSNYPSDSSSGKLKGIIENQWYREVVVQVCGPGGFFREFTVKARGQSPVFNLPIIGEYTAVFIFGRESKPIKKIVGPNIVYYGSNGELYDYKATLQTW